MRRHEDPAIRFWRKVHKTDSCWLWTAATNACGYGSLGVGDRRTMLAHRFAYQLLVGPIPAGVEVCHDCPGGDNPACVNPDHLFLGTHKQNMRDAAAKGRMGKVRGERTNTAKLTAEKVLDIRRRYAAGEATQEELGAEYGVAHSAIGGITRGKTWRHLFPLSG